MFGIASKVKNSDVYDNLRYFVTMKSVYGVNRNELFGKKKNNEMPNNRIAQLLNCKKSFHSKWPVINFRFRIQTFSVTILIPFFFLKHSFDLGGWNVWFVYEKGFLNIQQRYVIVAKKKTENDNRIDCNETEMC